MKYNIDSRYTILNQVGSGGMASVFQAKDSTLGRDVAIKVIHPHLLGNPQALKRFENEARAIASLSHENIVRLYDYGKSDDCHFLVIELVKGLTLQEIIEKAGPFPNLVLISVFIQVFKSLSEAHIHGIYHRDIKPSNIMIDENGCVKIMDFGIAHCVNEESLTQTGTLVGSPNYISPEQASGTNASDRSDIFSAGSVMYECITGKAPFFRETVHATLMAIVEQEAEPLCLVASKTLPELEFFIQRCMCKDVQGRPDSLLAVRELLELSKKEGWECNKDRIVSFIKSPEECRKQEESEMWAHFRKKAHAVYKNSPISALRAISFAQLMKPLLPEDNCLIKQVNKQKTFKKIAGICAITAATIIFLFAYMFSSPYMQPRVSRNKSSQNQPLAVNQLTSKSEPNKAKDPVVIKNIEKPSDNAISRGTYQSLVKEIKQVRMSTASVTTQGNSNPAVMVDYKEDQVSKKAYVNIKTNPPWAKVIIDGLHAGSTPVVLELKAGNHDLVINKDGCEEYFEKLSLNGGDTSVKEIILKRN